MQSKRIFITGESGNIASLMIRGCKKAGAKIINSSYPKLARHNKRALPFVFGYDYKNELNICDYPLMEQIIKEAKPEIIIHCAAYVNTDKCDKDRKNAYKVNVDATEFLVQCSNKFSPGCLFVNFSTTATMDPLDYSLSKPITENTKRGPKTWYGETKLMGEHAMKKCSSKWINFLPVFLFNEFPYDNSSVWPKIFKNSLKKQYTDLQLDPKNTKQYEYGSNLLKPMIKIIENPESINKDVVIGGTERIKFELALEIAQEEFQDTYGKDIRYSTFPKGDYLHNHVADNSLMLKLSGLTLEKFNKKRIGFREAIREVAKSCR